MKPEEYAAIKERNERDRQGLDQPTDGDSVGSHENFRVAQEAVRDREELIRELDRFRSNFEAGLDLIDTFMQHHANTLPRKTKEQLQHLQVRLWGLL